MMKQIILFCVFLLTTSFLPPEIEMEESDEWEFLSDLTPDEELMFESKNPEGQILTYLIVNDSTVSVVGIESLSESRKPRYKSKSLTIPSEVSYQGKDYRVKYIQDFAFQSHSFSGGDTFNKVERVTIPEGIERVGQNCFASLPSLKEVIIPNSLRNLSYSMFENCPKLSQIKFSGNPELEEIEDFAFQNCGALKSFIIPPKVTKIGEGPWRGCTGLSEVRIDSSNSSFLTNDGVLLSGDGAQLIQYPAGRKEETYTVPSTVSAINNSAFHSNRYIQEVKFSDSTKEISHIAFRGCENLSKIYFPAGLAFIGNAAFRDCPKLREVSIPASTRFTQATSADDPYNTFMPATVINITVP